MHPQSWTGKLFALYCLSLQEAQAGVDVPSGQRATGTSVKPWACACTLMMERISTWMAAGTGAGFSVTKTMAVGRLLQVARKPRVGESVPINELMASMHAVRSVLLLKHTRGAIWGNERRL
jgi:hypothetical protein